MATANNVNQFLEVLVNRRNDDGEAAIFDTLVLSKLKDIEASPGTVTCTLMASPQLLNRFGTLHGGCIATIVDTVGTAAIGTQSERLGVSLNIDIDYHSPMPGLKECFIKGQVVKIGRTIASCTVEIRQKDTDQLVATGRHLKFISGKAQDNVRTFAGKPLKSKL